ncbi:MAG: protein kinase, partial [Myxococcales bacterium]|nr:protein kinase [Myxococcales bacterium]
PEQILAVFTAAGRGLAAIHDKGLIHRDFKPDNVMVDRSGRVLVMDLGIAREGHDRDEQPTPELPGKIDLSLTRTGALMGSPAYMAPEQFAAGELGAYTDQFAFCVALWEAL